MGAKMGGKKPSGVSKMNSMAQEMERMPAPKPLPSPLSAGGPPPQGGPGGDVGGAACPACGHALPPFHGKGK